MREALQPIIDKVWHHCEAAGITGRTVTLKVKYADFRQITRSHSVAVPDEGRGDLEAITVALLQPLMPPPKGVRLLGVTLSGLQPGGGEEINQMKLPI
jgi:DNA polymerase-4